MVQPIPGRPGPGVIVGGADRRTQVKQSGNFGVSFRRAVLEGGGWRPPRGPEAYWITAKPFGVSSAVHQTHRA